MKLRYLNTNIFEECLYTCTDFDSLSFIHNFFVQFDTSLIACCKEFVDSSAVFPMANKAVSAANVAVTYSLHVGTSLVNKSYSNGPNILA